MARYRVAVASALGDELVAVGSTRNDPNKLTIQAAIWGEQYRHAWIVDVADLPMVARTARRRAAARDDDRDYLATKPARETAAERLPSVRVTEAQLASYAEAADAAGLSVSDWIRGVLDAAAGG